MWRNFIRVSIRSISKNKSFNAINIAGLAIGLASAILIAMPAAYFIMQDWFRDFPYNVGFQPLLFLMAAVLTIVIALVTVTITSLKAVRTNPAMALHYE